MTKRQRRLLTVLIVLALLLASLAGYYAYYRTTKKLSFDLAGAGEAQITPPEFLYSFSGAGQNRVARPIGVLVDGGTVYVVDSATGRIQVFNERGEWQRSIGETESVTPLYIAKNPKDGNLYVTDRRTHSLHMYTTAGKYLGDFNPRLPKKELPTFETGGVQWVPLGIAFADDGTMFVTDVLKGHRLLIFGPDKKFKKSVGAAAIVLQPTQLPNYFQFPNGLTIIDEELYVADSNNRRVQVFDFKGNFKRLIVTEGLPRGVAPLAALPSDDASSPARFIAVDTLAHDGTIWTSRGKKVLSFGEQGLLDGQFNYPNGIAVGRKNRIFISDTSNARVQVWGWPDQVSSLPVVGNPSRLIWCLIPLALLPLLLLLRKRRFFATADFVRELAEMGELQALSSVKRVRWVTTEDQHAQILEVMPEDDSQRIFDVWEHSEPDAQAIMEKHEVDHGTAVVLSVAQRTRLLCSEDAELRVVASRMEIESADAREFLKKHAKKLAVQEFQGENE